MVTFFRYIHCIPRVIDISNASLFSTVCNRPAPYRSVHFLLTRPPTGTVILTRPKRYIPARYRVHARSHPHALPAPQCRTPNLSTYMNRPLFVPTRPSLFPHRPICRIDHPTYVCRAAPFLSYPAPHPELVAVRPAIDRGRRGIFDRLDMQ